MVIKISKKPNSHYVHKKSNAYVGSGLAGFIILTVRYRYECGVILLTLS